MLRYSYGMQTPCSLSDNEDFPLSCSVCLSEEGVVGTGRVWACDDESCHIQSALRVRPGALVSLSFQLSSGARVKLKPGIVTWAGRSEFGIRFLHEPAMRPQERSTS
jgi:hypothetical protein